MSNSHVIITGKSAAVSFMNCLNNCIACGGLHVQMYSQQVSCKINFAK